MGVAICFAFLPLEDVAGACSVPGEILETGQHHVVRPWDS